ncbi:hypothetical protein NGM37_32775, partial [Streptomyces sp. TRM76130]|nr:hypothetical protein [Streptomyces sp. TRM76130]
MAEQKSAAHGLPGPLGAAVTVLKRVPGAGTVGKVAGGVLDRIGALSPRGRRLAVYTGAGMAGVAGLVEWPVAAVGAAVAWLTRPRREESPGTGAGAGAGEASGTDADADRAAGGAAATVVRAGAGEAVRGGTSRTAAGAGTA